MPKEFQQFFNHIQNQSYQDKNHPTYDQFIHTCNKNKFGEASRKSLKKRWQRFLSPDLDLSSHAREKP
jgi:hypothetical protein